MWHLHEKQLVHRDIALRNVLLDLKSFEVKLSDFELSLIKTHKKKNNRVPIAWTSPECIRGEDPSKFSDIWSFGVTCWELLTEERPFDGEDLTKVSKKIRNDGRTLEIPED